MRRCVFIFTVAMILVTFLSAHAQNHRIGVIGGINIANLDEEDTNYDSRTTFGIGGILEFDIQDKFAICFEPMYLQKGASEEEEEGVTFDLKLAYLEIPVFFKIPLGTSAARPYIMAGPTLGILTSSKMEVGFMGLDIEVDADDLTESIDFGLGMGGGVSFPVGPNTIFIEARYTLGLMDIAKEGTIKLEDESETIPDSEVKTRGIQIMAGITIPLGMR